MRFFLRTSQLLFFVIILSIFLASSGSAQTKRVTVADSVLQQFSVEELVKIKKLLEDERQRLIKKQDYERQHGVEISQEFLNQTREENENQDMILIRVAEYYIEEAREDFAAAVETYNKDYEKYNLKYEAYQAGKLDTEPVAPQFPQKDFSQAISIYDLILTNFPESDLVDDALYNKAFLLEEMEEVDASRQVFLELIDKYPESEYTPEAYMHLAEHYFQPRLGQDREETIRNLNKAAQLYKNVLDFKESPRYDEALYKLGWTYYRLAAVDPQYNREAILYFTLVVKDVEDLEQYDPEGKYVKTNIKPEALQYIAASFTDTTYTDDGVSKAREFLVKMGKPSYGVEVFRNLGDIYARIVDYDNSIRAYRTLLDVYPDYHRAPMIRKKIADVYYENRDFEQAFRERTILFDEYNPKSEWYGKIEQSDLPDRIPVLDEAMSLTEEGLRQNIIYKLDQARSLQESGGDSLAAYREFVDLGKKYLETYPTHENAYEINWSVAYVLDTELKDYADAFNEYIRVSNDYLEDEHRADAATNAIVVAQTLVSKQRAGVDTTQLETETDVAEMSVQELSKPEEILAEAYDNYIKLFPNQKKTATYLSSAGALYYQHRQYDMARKYYKTMVTKFPEAQQKNVGLVSLMNSYFFLGKYMDAEFVAKKIAASNEIPEDQVEVAKRRVGESIYKNAERLEQEEKYVDAAREFYRVYTDAPYYTDIVDLALFNSARNYEKAGEWQQAINVYNTLVENFEDSKYRLVALGRIADAYKQLDDFAGVGSAYERIHELYPQSDDAEAALYNASLFYAKAESWKDAIRVNQTYIKTYPDNPDSKELMFENARYYLNLNDLQSANQIYDEFAQTYPGDKRTIEAFYRRGEYYYNNQQYDLAKQEFQKAIDKSDEFARTGRDPNLLYASESYFKLGEIEYNEFEAIQLTYPASTLKAQLQRKNDKLRSVVDAFSKVIAMGSLKGFEAMYKVAQAYEEMADAIANQELPPNLSPEQKLVESDKVFQASVPAYDRAVDEYKNVLKNIPLLAKKLEISLVDTGMVPLDTEVVEVEDTTLTIQKESIKDSTRQVALHWYNKAEEKISLILYTVAERSSDFIDAYLRQENPASGMVYLSWKKLLLNRAVAPAIQVTLDAHLKNINTSAQLDLDNKYVQESKRKILLTSNILADENAKLVKKAAEIYRNQVKTLKDLIESGENATTPDGLNSLDYNDQIMSIIDYMNEFQTNAIQQYDKTLKFAREHNIQNDAVLTTQDRLFNSSYESGTLLLDLSSEAAQNRDSYGNQSQETGDPKYQLGIVYFDDQQSILKNYAQKGLEASYAISKDFDVQSVWTNLILAKLVELQPAQYLGDLPREKFMVSTDSTWLASKEYTLDWNQAEFSDADWKHASKVPIPAGLIFAGFDSLQTKPPAIWLYHIASNDTTPVDTMMATVSDSASTDTSMQAIALPDSMRSDSLLANDTTGVRSLELMDKELPEESLAGMQTSPDSNVAIPPDTNMAMQQDTTTATPSLVQIPQEPDTLSAYFRKRFTLQDRPINGWALITADDRYYFYLNGEYIKGDDVQQYEHVDGVSFVEIGDFLKTGDNLVAIEVTDFDGPPRNGLRFYMELEMLPVEITSAAEKIRQRAAESVEPARLNKVVILNKNRIVE